MVELPAKTKDVNIPNYANCERARAKGAVAKAHGRKERVANGAVAKGAVAKSASQKARRARPERRAVPDFCDAPLTLVATRPFATRSLRPRRLRRAVQQLERRGR
jgi:hypothetical protein